MSKVFLILLTIGLGADFSFAQATFAPVDPNQKTEQPDQLSNPIEIANQQQIAILEANTKLGKTPIKVNASSLLSEVDGELELSFREKVINKIDKNYKTVKVALANRNQQSINQ